MRNLLESIELPQQATVLYGDNQGSLFLGDNPKTASRTKHIAIKYHHVQELTDKTLIKLVYLETKKMIADVFTKAVPAPIFQKHLKSLLNMSA